LPIVDYIGPVHPLLGPLYFTIPSFCLTIARLFEFPFYRLQILFAARKKGNNACRPSRSAEFVFNRLSPISADGNPAIGKLLNLTGKY
jgi:hypothetical protein